MPVALLLWFVLAGFHSAQSLNDDLAFYQPSRPEPLAISQPDWLAGGWATLPAFRDDLEGRHHHPLTVQWMGSLAQLRAALEPHGWRAPPNAGVVRLMDLFNSEADIEDMPILPQLHQGRPQRLLLTRYRPGENHIATLRLWESGYFNPREHTTLWIGSASSLVIEDRFRLLRFLRTDTDFNTPLQQLVADLDGFDIRQVQRSQADISAADVDWNGQVVLVKPSQLSE